MMIAHLFSVVLVSAGLVIFGWWVSVPQQYNAVNITAATDIPSMGLPVFSQYTYTQSLQLAEPINFSQLAVPIYSPTSGVQMNIMLTDDHGLVDNWQYVTIQSDKVVQVNFKPSDPVIIDGPVQIQFSVPAVEPDLQAKAPRIFIESADSYYPQGNYRIANNDKSGDIALSLLAVKPRYDFIIETSLKNPANVISKMLTFLIIMLLIGAVPYLITKIILGLRRGDDNVV